MEMHNKKNSIYLDNAATTQLDSDVLQAMMPYLTHHYGNPSALHHLGNKARLAIEEARKKIAALVGVKSRNIIFTSGGTESNNTAILSALRDFDCDHIITSRIEHHAVLHPVEYYAEKFGVGISYVKLYEDGSVNQNHFRRLLEMKSALGKKCLVTLMHANNETGQITEIRWISSLCKNYGAIFHSDCVQTIGHYPVDLTSEGIHMASASAHKFHGSKGIGFLYVHDDLPIAPLIFGGEQERGYRAGIENVASIVGMAEALHLSYKQHEVQHERVLNLKNHLTDRLRETFPFVSINSSRFSLYSVLSISVPKTEESEFLLMKLDQQGICVSGGAACSGGASHVMKQLGKAETHITIRFSFSRYNTMEEIDKVVETFVNIFHPQHKELVEVEPGTL